MPQKNHGKIKIFTGRHHEERSQKDEIPKATSDRRYKYGQPEHPTI
jgi:hypothetical protein